MSNTISLAQLVTQPLDALCGDDLDQYGGELTDPLAVYKQDFFHRLIEPPGSNPDDPDRGLGLEELCSSPVSAGGLELLIQNEILKDRRASTCTANVRVTDNGNAGQTVTISIVVEVNRQELKLEVIVDKNGARLS